MSQNWTLPVAAAGVIILLTTAVISSGILLGLARHENLGERLNPPSPGRAAEQHLEARQEEIAQRIASLLETEPREQEELADKIAAALDRPAASGPFRCTNTGKELKPRQSITVTCTAGRVLRDPVDTTFSATIKVEVSREDRNFLPATRVGEPKLIRTRIIDLTGRSADREGRSE